MKNKMHTQVVLLVSRTHWRCVTCKLLKVRTVSIDKHLEYMHPRESTLSTPSVDRSVNVFHSFSDSDADPVLDAFRQGREIKANVCAANRGQAENSEEKQTDASAPLAADQLRSAATKSAKREQSEPIDAVFESKHLRPQASRAEIRDVEHGIQDTTCSENHVTKSLSEEEHLADSVQNDAPFFLYTAGKSSLQNKNANRDEVESEAIRHQDKNKEVKVSQSSACSSSKQTSGQNLSPGHTSSTGRKRKTIVKSSRSAYTSSVINTRKNKVKKTAIKDTFSGSQQQTCLATTPSQPGQGKRKTKHKVGGLARENEVDKCKIATSCVPWLLERGRKAGDKLVRKTRRLLLPEEKQALRQLYCVHIALKETSNHASLASEGQKSNHESIDSKDSWRDNLPQQQLMVACSSVDTPAKDVLSPASSGLPPPQQRVFAHSLIPGHSSTVDAKAMASHHRQNVLPHPAPGLPQDGTATDSSVQARLVESSFRSLFTSPACADPHVDSPSDCAPYRFTVTSALVRSDVTSNNDVTAEKQMGGSHRDHCKVCKRTFESASELKKHQNEADKLALFECRRCGNVKFHGIHDLNLHVFSVHEVEKQGFCFVCDRDAHGLEDLERHVYKHAFGVDKPLAEVQFHDCRLCGAELESRPPSTIPRHYRHHHVALACSYCWAAFQSRRAYSDHARQLHGDEPRVCGICGAAFPSDEELDRHWPCPEDVWLEDGRGKQCPKCGLWCPNKAVVEAHRRQHRSQDDVQAYRDGAKTGFPCVSCEKVFKNKHACRRHAKMVHEGVSCYIHYCEYCGKGFLTKGHMQDHIAVHHLHIKRYTCDYCHKQFVCGPTLKRHTRKEHTKHKPYQCQHCDERFFEKTPLQRHLTSHTGLAPFMCEQCGKGFYTKYSFRNHGASHSSSKEFTCAGCQKGFTRKYSLQAHLKVCKNTQFADPGGNSN